MSDPTLSQPDAKMVLYRLDQIDKNISVLSASVSRLVLVEDRQAQANLALDRAFKLLDVQSARINALENAGVLNNRTSAWVERGLLACAGALLAIIYKNLIT